LSPVQGTSGKVNSRSVLRQPLAFRQSQQLSEISAVAKRIVTARWLGQDLNVGQAKVIQINATGQMLSKCRQRLKLKGSAPFLRTSSPTVCQAT
jgi:hypothetical protein